MRQQITLRLTPKQLDDLRALYKLYESQYSFTGMIHHLLNKQVQKELKDAL